MNRLLQAIRSAGDPTRLRILALCAHAELTVSDLVGILGQSQPRISRHLKILVEAGLLERYQEGSWARYRLATDSSIHLSRSEQDRSVVRFGEQVIDLLPQSDDVLSGDMSRLERLREIRDQEAAEYFARNAENWGQIRSLYVDEARVSEVLTGLLKGSLGRLLDIGTGTGHILELLADQADAAVGIDQSQPMLSIARSAIEGSGLGHCQVRHADMYQLPFPAEAFDTVTIHMVLHYAEDPAAALAEASRVLAPGGQMAIVDFTEHNLLEMRSVHAHRWPGFADNQIEDWCASAGLTNASRTELEGGPLTVCVWRVEKSQAADNGKDAASG